MDSADRLERPIRFLSRDISSKALLRFARLAFASAIGVMALGMASLGFGLISDMYTYGGLVNSVPIFLPLVLFEALSKKRWSGLILRVQNLAGLIFIVAAVVVDSVMLAYLGTIYRLCFGDQMDQCEYGKNNEYTCQTSFPGLSSNSNINCSSKSAQSFGLTCVSVNYAVVLLMVVYLVLSHRLRNVVVREELQTETQVPGAYPEPVVISIVGFRVAGLEDDSNIEIAYPAPAKPNLSMNEVNLSHSVPV